MDVEGVHILNRTKNKSAVTNHKGDFFIETTVNDTLIFSALQFYPKILIVTQDILKMNNINVEMVEKVNILEKVVLTPYNLSGDMAKDIKNIDLEPQVNFYDLGIPGFKGTRKEKIVSVGEAIEYGLNTKIKIDPLYKHISGYYKNLKTRRKWDSENLAVTRILNYFGYKFFVENYDLEQDQVYVFVLGCVSATDIETDFYNKNFGLVLDIFKNKSKESSKNE